MNFAKPFWHPVQISALPMMAMPTDLSLSPNRGVPLSGEWTLAFVVDFILGKTKGDVVATVSTSQMLDDIAANHGVGASSDEGRCGLGGRKDARS